MNDIEVFKLSAKACEHEVCEEHGEVFIRGSDGEWELWTPFTSDSQRWECEKKLLELLGSDAHIFMNQNTLSIWPVTPGFCEPIVMPYGFPIAKFPARALAELESRKVPK